MSTKSTLGPEKLGYLENFLSTDWYETKLLHTASCDYRSSGKREMLRKLHYFLSRDGNCHTNDSSILKTFVSRICTHKNDLNSSSLSSELRLKRNKLTHLHLLDTFLWQTMPPPLNCVSKTMWWDLQLLTQPLLKDARLYIKQQIGAQS